MSKIPKQLLPAIVVPVSMLLIATFCFVFYRQKINRFKRNQNSDEQFSSGASENYETPYENNVYEEYMINKDRPNHISTQTNFCFECSTEETAPIDKPEELLPDYISQLKKDGEFEKIRQVMAEIGYPVRWWLSPDIQVPGKVNK